MKKNLRYFMTLLLMMVASVGWAEDVTIATATFNGKNATYTEGWTTTGTGVGRTDCIIIGAGENITSPSFDLTKYSTVTITFKARRYGSLSGSKATVDASIGETSVGTIDFTGTTVGAISGGITFTPTSSMTSASIVFTCTNATSAGSTHGAGIGEITIVGAISGTTTLDSDLTLSPTSVELDLAGTKTQDLSITTSSTGAITWTSSNPDVATVNNGKVTAVAVGTATITASQAADATYRAGEATCVVNVINSESTEQTVSFVAGTDKGTNGSSGNADTMTKGGITVSGTSLATTTAEYRVYANSTFTISSTVGKIIKIEFTGVSSYPVSRFGEVEGLTTSGNNGTWTGSASSVSFTPSSQVRLSSINVTYERLDETVSASPEISGTTPFLTSTNVTITAAEGASIYYTTDGTDPSESSTVYTGPFAITATTTVKAIAVEQGKSASEISEETFTKTESYTLGEIYSLDAGKYYVNFNNAVVTYVNGSYTFIQDNSGAVMYYKYDGGYTAGQVLNGTAYVEYTVYQGQPEITNITPEEGMTVTDGTAVEPTVVTLASLVENPTTYISKYVKVEGVEATSTSELSQNGTTLAFYGRNNAAIETGKRYDIIGFLGNHNGTYQLTTYTPDHVQELADERQDPNISFSVETLEITQGEEFEAPTFNNENNVEVTFDTDNEDVATWDATNGLTLGTATGTATITATFEGNDTYKYATAQLTVTVNAQITPITGDYYEKVTSTEDITDGEYLIVYETGNVAFDGSLETLDAEGNTIPVTIVENKIAATEATNAATFTIDTTNGTLKSASGQYIGVSSNSNGLKQTTESDTYTHSFSFDADGNAVIAAVFEGSTMTLRYNSASNQARFRYYKSGQQAIQLYKKVSDTPAVATPIDLTNDEVVRFENFSNVSSTEFQSGKLLLTATNGKTYEFTANNVKYSEGLTFIANADNHGYISTTVNSLYGYTVKVERSGGVASIEIDGNSIEYNELDTEKTESNFKLGSTSSAPIITSITFCPTIKLTVGETGYATIYYSDRDINIVSKQGATPFEASTYKLDENGALVPSKTYSSFYIPHGEAVVLKGTPNDYFLRTNAPTREKDPDNLLKGSDVEEMTTGGSKYYALAMNANGDADSVGFYWQAANGGAFTNGAHKAYLALPAGTEAKSAYLFSEDISTGINGVNKSNNAEVRYNMQGQRVGNAYKGVVIKNGKKFLQK